MVQKTNASDVVQNENGGSTEKVRFLDRLGAVT